MIRIVPPVTVKEKTYPISSASPAGVLSRTFVNVFDLIHSGAVILLVRG